MIKLGILILKNLESKFNEVYTHSNEATLMRALESSIGHSSCSLGVAGSKSLPSSSNGIQSSTVTFRQVP